MKFRNAYNRWFIKYENLLAEQLSLHNNTQLLVYNLNASFIFYSTLHWIETLFIHCRHSYDWISTWILFKCVYKFFNRYRNFHAIYISNNWYNMKRDGYIITVIKTGVTYIFKKYASSHLFLRNLTAWDLTWWTL